MRFDHINLRFQLIRWTAIAVAILLPVITWFIARSYFDLGQMATAQLTLLVTVIAFLVLRFIANYLQDGFARSYADGGSWDYLYARFGVRHTPTAVGNLQTGFGQLDRDDVVFEAQSGLCDDGLYVNFSALGRLLVPWGSIVMLTKRSLLAYDNVYDAAAVLLDGPDADLCIPWADAFEGEVPASIGVNRDA